MSLQKKKEKEIQQQQFKKSCHAFLIRNEDNFSHYSITKKQKKQKHKHD